MKKNFLTPFLLSLFACSHVATAPNPYETATLEKQQTFKSVMLPFLSGTPFFISQGAFGKASHSEPGNEYSWDFDVPLGTEIDAVEGGKVVEVWAPALGGGCDPKFSNSAHDIKILHADGTVAQYVHVESTMNYGDTIHSGQKIGFTGNSGWLCSPQLHFGIYRSMQKLYNSPHRETIPLKFDGILPAGIAQEGYRGKTPPRQL